MQSLDVTNKYFDLSKTLHSGQVFGWTRYLDYYVGFIHKDKWWDPRVTTEL